MESGNPWVNNRSFIVVFALVDTAIMLQGFEIFICNYFLHLSACNVICRQRQNRPINSLRMQMFAYFRSHENFIKDGCKISK